MGTNPWNVVLIGLVILGLSSSVSALMCYQCNSSLDSNCQEMFDHSSGQNPLRSIGCDLFEAKYCIKTIGIWGGIAGTHRFCSAKNLGNQCQYIRYPDHDRIYQACLYTCTRDDCNSAHSHIPHLCLYILLGTLAFLLQRRL